MARGKVATQQAPAKSTKPTKEFSFSQISIKVKPKTENQKKFVQSIHSNIVTIGNGTPGTGKTYLAVAEALRLLLNPDSKITRILLVKSVTPLNGEEVGFLKGDLKEKMEPIMYSFMSNFYKIIGEEYTNKLVAMGLIQFSPLAFLRGQSIDNAVILADEMQNVSIENSKTLLTRIGDNTKMIITGDSKQIDMKNKKLSSLDRICKAFDGYNEFGITLFTKVDQQRNPIVNLIEEVFEEKIENPLNPLMK